MPQTIGLVLAGGSGERFGRSKGDLRIGGVTLAERAARSLSPLCGSVLVSTAAGDDSPAPGYQVVEDPDPAGRGPLAGIGAAFSVTGTADLLVLACDYPRVETAFLKALLERAGNEGDLTIVTDRRGRDHPLVGLWRRSAEAGVRAALDDRIYKVRALFTEVDVRRLGERELREFDLDNILLNVNTPEDLDAMKE
jgi:molybdopterin-guanine dinucleotide biosynthesis protein A